MATCRRALVLLGSLGLGTLLGGCGEGPVPALRVGALFPLQGPQSSLAREEYAGIQIAAALVNADGGVHGRRVELDPRELDTPAQAPTAVQGLRQDRVPVVLGTYSSLLSMPASSAAATAGLTYWEAGAVADRVTGRGLGNVFRVGATGANLGDNSGRFAAEQLVPRLGLTAATTRVSILYEDDDYGRSVARAAAGTAAGRGLPVVSQTRYDAYAPDWPRVIAELTMARPDILVLASYIPDGVSFRRAMLAAHLHVGALIGSTMAECGPEFGDALGADAVGVFASDRPTAGFNSGALLPAGQAAYQRLAGAWKARFGRLPTEEGLAGFSAAWTLFHYVLPHARLDPAGIADAARSTRLPQGTLPNGGGLSFAGPGERLGQNLAAAAVIWQWQGVRRSVTVWPAVYATGAPALVPLPQ